MLIRYFQTLLFLDSRDQRGWTHWLGDVTTLWLDVYWGVDVLKHKWYISAGIQLSYLCCRLVASSIPIDHLRTNTAHHMNHTSLLLVWTRARFENITIEDKSSSWQTHHCTLYARAQVALLLVFVQAFLDWLLPTCQGRYSLHSQDNLWMTRLELGENAFSRSA